MYDDAHAVGEVWDRWSLQNTITGVMNGDPYHSIHDGKAGQVDFDGGGGSYSAQALAAVGLKAGQPVTRDGFTFTWPERRPGQLDNLQASGQAVDLPSAPPGVRNVTLGAPKPGSGTPHMFGSGFA